MVLAQSLLLIEKAPAKINLTLAVFERQADGYHRVETLMTKVSLADEVQITLESGQGLSVEVPGYPELNTLDNLAAQAAKGYLEGAGLRRKVHIQIQKEIPIAAGLGGGSSDAAAVLRAMDQSLKAWAAQDLGVLARQLGADVPFLLGESSWALGRNQGDELISLSSLPSRPVVLVNPGFGVSTAKAYQALGRPLTWDKPNGNSIALQAGPKNWSDLEELFGIGNDLQKVVEAEYPEVARIRQRLTEVGAFFAQMSGSGATVFGLFHDMREARQAAQELKQEWKVFVTQTGTV